MVAVCPTMPDDACVNCYEENCEEFWREREEDLGPKTLQQRLAIFKENKRERKQCGGEIK
jgi:hypothetical protein